MSSVRRGEVHTITDGKESVASLYEHMERMAQAYGRLHDWPVCELDALRIAPTRWGGFYSASMRVSLSGPDVGEGE